MIGDVTNLGGRFRGKIFVNYDNNTNYPNASQPITFKDIEGMHDYEWKHNQIRISFTE